MKKLIYPLAIGLLAFSVPAAVPPGNAPADLKSPADWKSPANWKSPAKDWKLGVQLWTFMKFDFVTAISKVDSSGIKYVEAFSHQPLGGGMKGFFGPDMTADQKAQIKKLLKAKGIQIVAMG